MPFRFWKGMAERITETDRVLMLSLRMYLKISNTHCNKSDKPVLNYSSLFWGPLFSDGMYYDVVTQSFYFVVIFLSAWKQIVSNYGSRISKPLWLRVRLEQYLYSHLHSRYFTCTYRLGLMLLLLEAYCLKDLMSSLKIKTRCSAIAERPRCRVSYSFRQK